MHDDRSLSTARTLPYPPEAVYAAFAMPEVLASWWGPKGFTNDFEVFEFRVGGPWKFVMHGPDGKAYRNESVFTSLVPGAEVVIEHLPAPHFVLAVRLAAVDGGTHLTWDQRFDDAATARAIEHIVGDANEQNLDRLTQALGRAAAPQDPIH